MSPLRAALDDYLRIRRSLGFKLELDGKRYQMQIQIVEIGSKTAAPEAKLEPKA